MQLMRSFKGFEFSVWAILLDERHQSRDAGGCCPVLRATECFETYITRSKNDFCTSFSRSGILAVFVT